MSEVGRLGRNFSAVALAQLISQILTLVVSIALARALGVEQYGIFVFGFAFPSWFLLFASLGLDAVLAIDVAADRSRARSYLTTIAILRIPLVLIAVAALWVSVNLVLSDPFARTITLVLGIASILGTYAGTFGAMFRAFERLEYVALVTIVERAVTTVAILLLLLFGFGLLEISLAFIFGSLLNLILSLVILRTKFVRFESRLNLAIAWKIMKRTAAFALAAVVATFMYSTGPVLLTILQNPTETGQFNAAFTLTLALLAPLTIYNIVFLPTMSRIYREARAMLSNVIQKSQKLFFILGLPTALGGWFYAQEIMTLFYGDAFRISAKSFELLIIVVAISTAVLGIGTALSATGHQPLNLAIGLVGAVINVGLCFALIPSLGHVGAAYAFLVTRLVSGVLHLAAVRRIVRGINLFGTLSRPALAGTAMIAFLYIMPDMPFLLGILGGGLLYFALLFAVHGITREDLTLVRDALRGVFSARQVGP